MIGTNKRYHGGGFAGLPRPSGLLLRFWVKTPAVAFGEDRPLEAAKAAGKGDEDFSAVYSTASGHPKN